MSQAFQACVGPAKSLVGLMSPLPGYFTPSLLNNVKSAWISGALTRRRSRWTLWTCGRPQRAYRACGALRAVQVLLSQCPIATVLVVGHLFA